MYESPWPIWLLYNRRAFIIIPERLEGKGWRSCCLDLQKELSFRLSLGDGIRVLSSHRLLGGLPLSGVGGSTSAIEVLAQRRLLEKGHTGRLGTIFGSSQNAQGQCGISEFRERRRWGGSDGRRLGWCQGMVGFMSKLPSLKLHETFWVILWNFVLPRTCCSFSK